MAQKDNVKPFRVAVVGLPSSSPNSNLGAGKSCLCNRFTKSSEDEFSSSHSSVLNHEDFTGPIVNGTHFIYWGQTSCPAEDGTPIYFQIIEQTEFCQDGSFNVFSSAQPYMKRAFATKNLPSASGKVAYYGPDQFVDVQKYPNPEKFPDKFQIDGFVLCVDASLKFGTSPLDTQKYFEKLISEALQTKKPLVIAATKFDKMNQATVEKLQAIVASSKSKRSQVVIVETSSINNVNVDTVFHALAEQMGGNKVRFRTKSLPYVEAKKIVEDRKQQARNDFDYLLGMSITDCQLTPRKGVDVVKSHEAYQNFIKLHGSTAAKTIVRKHINKLHEAQVEKKKAEFLSNLPDYLSRVVPVVAPTAKIEDLTKHIRSSEKFSEYFIVLEDDEQWEDSPVLTSPDNRIPFQFLKSEEATIVLQEYLTSAQQQYHHRVAMEKIKSVLEASKLKPGQPLEEQLSSLNLSNQLNQLQSREELTELYQSYMKRAEEETLKDFTELLWEHPELFIARSEDQQKMLESSVDVALGSNILTDDARFQRLQYRGDKCKAEMLRHLALFVVKKGEIKKSTFQEFIANRIPRQDALMINDNSPWVLDITDVYYNIALVGTEHICNNLKNDIMSLCKANRFKCNDIEYQFEFQIFPPTTVMLSDEAFTPQGAIFIVSSDKLLMATEKSVKELFSINGPYRGLPVAMVYVGEEFMPESNHPLSIQAVRLSRWLQACHVAEKWSVFPDKVLAAESASRLLQGLLERTRHTEAFLRREMCTEIADMSVAVCTTPDESYNHEDLLLPFLANQMAFYKDDHVFQQIQIEEKFYSIAITCHSSTNLESLLSKPLNGFIIVYSSSRKASWKLAMFLVGQLPQIPMLLVCVHDETAGEELVREGERLANDKEYVLFLNTQDYWQPGCLNEFFTKCWFSRFSSMQKQHVKMSKQLSTRALPSRPHSESVRLRSLPSTPAISSQRPVSSLGNYSEPGGHLGPLQEILTMENGALNTYDTPDGCVFSKTSTDKKSSVADEPLEYATSSTMKHLVDEHKFRSLPRLPRTPSEGSDSIYSVASGDRSGDQSVASLYSQVGDQFSSSSHQQAVGSSEQDLYSVVDKTAKKTPTSRSSQPQDIYSVVDKSAMKTADQPSGQSTQSQDIYSVVDKSATKTADQPSVQSTQPQDIYSVVDKSAMKTADQPSGQSTQPQDIYSVVDKYSKKPANQLFEPLTQSQDIYSVIDKSLKNTTNQPSGQLTQPQDIYSVIDKSSKKTTDQPSGPLTQPQDIYSVVDKSTKTRLLADQSSALASGHSVPGKSPKFRRGKSADQLSVQATEESQGISHRPVVKKKLIRPHQQLSSDLHSVVEKKNNTSVEEKHEDVYSEIGNPTITAVTKAQNSLDRHQSVPQQDQLYSVVHKPPAVKVKTKRPSPGDIYSVVNRSSPQVKPKPRQYNSEHGTSDQSRPADMANGDVYSVVNKPPPVAKKPDRQRRILSDSSVTMGTGTQEDAVSHDDVAEDEPVIPDRCYDDDELELDDEPPELPPRLYSLSDFDTEDELCFDDIMEDLIPDRTFENPLYQSIISCKPQRPGEEEPLYQTLASFRKEMEDNKPKTGILKSTPQSAKNDKIRERLQRQAEKERARRLKQEERNRKRQEEAKRRQEQARIREEKKLRKKRAGSRKQVMPFKPYIPPNEAAGGKYFGLPLSEVCSNKQPIPVYVEQCGQLIEENGITQLGIYRVSGKKDDVLNLHAKFDDDPSMDIRPLGVCVNALASGLKSFFKLLPEPLISESMGNQLLTVAKAPDEDQLFKLKEVIAEMPQINRKILHFLATHLNKIMQQQEVNKMNASNLAIVFWPTLMRPPIADLADLSKQIDWQLMMTRIIDNPSTSCDPS